MTSNKPFEQLTGKLDVYIAAVGTAIPAVDATPGASWTLLGATDGEQSIQHAGSLTYFRDNDNQGPVKAVRPEEDVIISFTLVSLTLEKYAAVLDSAANVSSAAGPPATKSMPLKRGGVVEEYALLFRGSALSPYGIYPGMYVIPRGVFDGEPQPTFGKDQRAGLEVEFHALEDSTQSNANNSLGYLIAQTS